MKSFLRNLIGSESVASNDETASFKDLQIATAVLLIQAARADDSFEDDERQEIVDSLSSYFAISSTEVEEILARSEQAIERSLDDYEFTSLLCENLSIAERIEIMEMIWKVVFADHRLHGHEDHLAHRFARLLRLDHRQMIDAKLKVKNVPNQ